MIAHASPMPIESEIPSGPIPQEAAAAIAALLIEIVLHRESGRNCDQPDAEPQES